MLRELSVAEQCHQAVLAVIEDDVEVTAVAEKHGVSRRAVHAWLSRYAEGPLSVLPGRRADGARDLASGLRRSRRILVLPAASDDHDGVGFVDHVLSA